MKIDDPERVREQYAFEGNLRARQSIYGAAEGVDPRELALTAVAEVTPREVLEVGGGQGELSERIVRELGVKLTFLDISPRMVELARARGLDARVGDVQKLPFADGSFDVAVAAWMLYHVPDLDRGLAQLERVLVPGGRLVAVTNAREHLSELRELFPRSWESSFVRENGAEILSRHFAIVERRDADRWITIESREAVFAYHDSLKDRDEQPLPDFEVPLRVRSLSSVFVATKAA